MALGKSLLFAGTGYVLLKAAPILGGLTNAYIQVQFNTSNTSMTGSGQTLYSERGSTGNDIWKVDMFGSTNLGKIGLTYRDDAGTLTQIMTPVAYNNSVTHTISITKTGTAISINVDGSITTGSITGTNTFTNATVEARVGGDKADTAADFFGNIDNLYIGTSPTNITSSYYFNEGTGTTTADNFAINNGTLSGTTPPTWQAGLGGPPYGNTSSMMGV